MEFCAAFEVCAALKAARTVAPRPKNKLAETKTSKPAPLTALMNPNEFLFVNNKCESSTVEVGDGNQTIPALALRPGGIRKVRVNN